MAQGKQITRLRFLGQLLLLACLIFALTACGSRKDEETKETAATPPVSTEDMAGDAATAAPSQADSETTAPAGTDGAAMDGQPGSGTLKAVRDAVAEAYGENYLPEMELDAETLEMLYGVTPEMYDEAFGEIPMISAQVDTLILVKAKEGRAADVQAALENYRTYQLEEGMNYPMNVPKIEASEVLVYGDYVCYIMLGMIDNSIEDEAKMLTAFQEQNEIGKAVLEQQLAQ